jgi:uncharacterized cupredoxin-like copper-binding protein
MAPAHARLAAAVTTLALVCAGCGAGGDGDRVRAPRGKLTVRLVDFRIEPQEILARRGETTVEVVNAGRLPHNFQVLAGSSTRIGFTTLLPGESASKVRRLTRGTYEILCTVANHRELGMYGTLRVR